MGRHEFVPRHGWRVEPVPFPWRAINWALVVMTLGLWLLPWGVVVCCRRFVCWLKLPPVSER